MYLLKSILVSAFFTYCTLAAIFSLTQITDANALLWAANFVTLITPFVYLLTAYLFKNIPRTTYNMRWTTLFMLFNTVLVIFATLTTPQHGYLALVLNIIGVLYWLLYMYWITDFSERDRTVLQVGEALPNAHLKDVEGNTVQLSSFSNTPSIFLFYRGNWCPFCMAQIRELAADYQKIKEAGANLIFISPQNQKHTKNLAKQFNIPAIFLIDEGLKAARKLGIFNKNGTPMGFQVLNYSSDNVYPTLIVTDKNGIVQFADLTDNYRIRPEPNTYLQILESI
jgi:peroxiredoxin